MVMPFDLTEVFASTETALGTVNFDVLGVALVVPSDAGVAVVPVVAVVVVVVVVVGVVVVGGSAIR